MREDEESGLKMCGRDLATVGWEGGCFGMENGCYLRI